ncbi:MAG: sugar transferase [Sedimentisphaerales bacterium]|nr:sugar transferase [Sedimentisphaerales bacterium]
MQLIVIHRENFAPGRSGILHSVLSSESLATLLLDGLTRVNSFNHFSQAPLIAIPKEWQIETSLPETSINFYKQDIAVELDRVNNTKRNQWFIISNGRFITDIDHEWLFGILTDLNADVISVNVDSGLTAFREKIRITSQKHIAGFSRLYSDTAQELPVPDSWPQHLFVNIDILKELLVDGMLPLNFQEILSGGIKKSLTLRSISIAGKALDLEAEDDFLALIDFYLNSIWPGNHQKYMRLLGSNNILVDKNARFFGKVFLGHNVRIRQDVIIVGPAIIGDNVEISNEVTVKSSVIGPHITVPEKYYIRNRVVTDDTQLNGEHFREQKGSVLRRYCITSQAFRQKNRFTVFRTWPRFSYAGCFKRFFDIIAALVLVVLFAPVLPILMLAVKLSSPGPVFFKDKRQGLHGKEFSCLKFRTMMTGTDRIQSKLRAISQVDGPQFKIEDDPRITTVGKFMRDTCLDEIPQFFNVLLGQMSLIGPRPSPVSENSLCPPWRDARLSVRPGITGLWQICRTRQQGQDFQEWIHYDVKYVRELTFKLDLWIFWQTTKKLIVDFVRHF